MAIPAGLEPATLCLEGRCSIQLSYGTSFEIWAFYHGSILNQSAKTRTNSQIGQGSRITPRAGPLTPISAWARLAVAGERSRRPLSPIHSPTDNSRSPSSPQRFLLAG